MSKRAQNTHLTAEPILKQCAVYGSWPLIASKPGSSLSEWCITSQPWSDATCPRTTSHSAHFRFVTLFSSKRTTQSTKKRWYGGRLRQTMVDSWCCLDRVVPEGMSQVWRRSEVGNHKQRTLNSQLCSGTSEHTGFIQLTTRRNDFSFRVLPIHT